MPRGLDHVVHAVRDLDRAAETYRRLGFTVGEQNRHPWGTHNRIVQLPGFFVELLAMGAPGMVEPSPPDAQGFSFAAFNRQFISRGEGLSMLALQSRDADTDAESFTAAAAGASRPFRFERTGSRPDGTAVTVGFSLVFLRDVRSPEVGFFVCQQHHPENFWDPAFQAHVNGVSAIAAVVLVAENPTDHHILLSTFTGERELNVTSSGITVSTPRGVIQIMEPTAFRNQLGVAPPDIARGARLAALRLRVRDMNTTRAQLALGGADAIRHMGRLIVGPASAHGAVLAFEPDG
jgi:catechol 2,3-dioxygenase-like lactoylglutathione lyase family enzyme